MLADLCWKSFSGNGLERGSEIYWVEGTAVLVGARAFGASAEIAHGREDMRMLIAATEERLADKAPKDDAKSG